MEKDEKGAWYLEFTSGTDNDYDVINVTHNCHPLSLVGDCSLTYAMNIALGEKDKIVDSKKFVSPRDFKVVRREEYKL